MIKNTKDASRLLLYTIERVVFWDKECLLIWNVICLKMHSWISVENEWHKADSYLQNTLFVCILKSFSRDRYDYLPKWFHFLPKSFFFSPPFSLGFSVCFCLQTASEAYSDLCCSRLTYQQSKEISLWWM